VQTTRCIRIELAALSHCADQRVAKTFAKRREFFSFIGIGRFDPHVVERFAARFDGGENRRESVLARKIAKMCECDQALPRENKITPGHCVAQRSFIGGSLERDEGRVRIEMCLALDTGGLEFLSAFRFESGAAVAEDGVHAGQ